MGSSSSNSLGALPLAAIVSRLAQATAHPAHAFLADDYSLLDANQVHWQHLMMRFGIKPKAALLSHSNFGSSNQPSAVKMRQTLELLRVQPPRKV